MTTIEKPLNLLFSLPHELITYIFQSFDSTYRIFHTDKFRKELIGTGWLNLHKTLIKQRIESYIFDMVDNLDCIVTNEYGYLGDFESLQDHERNLLKYTKDNLEIYLFPVNNYMYYKFLPKGSTKENCVFLRNPRRFDGFIGSADRCDNYDKFISIGYKNLINKYPVPICEWSDGLSLHN